MTSRGLMDGHWEMVFAIGILYIRKMLADCELNSV